MTRSADNSAAVFLNGLDEASAAIGAGLRDRILAGDSKVVESLGQYMNSGPALCYTHGGVQKYVIAKTRLGLTFHSMVIYANPEVAGFIRKVMSGVRLQKGCFNIVAPEAFDLEDFDALIRVCAEQNFQPVIDHYARMAKRRKKSGK